MIELLSYQTSHMIDLLSYMIEFLSYQMTHMTELPSCQMSHVIDLLSYMIDLLSYMIYMPSHQLRPKCHMIDLLRKWRSSEVVQLPLTVLGGASSSSPKRRHASGSSPRTKKGESIMRWNRFLGQCNR